MLRLKKAGLRNPHSISIKEKNRENVSTPNELRLRYCVLEPRSKLSFLINFLRTNRKSKIVVYFLTCNQVDYFHAVLRQFLDVAVIKVSYLLSVLELIFSASVGVMIENQIYFSSVIEN